MINKAIFLLKESFVLIIRTKVPSIVSSLAISVGILVLTIAYCLFMTFEDLTLNYKDRYTIEVYFDENIKKNQAIEEFNQILLLDGIEEGFFISKNEAARIFKREFDEDILNVLGFNPLPYSASYTISDNYRNQQSIEELIDSIKVFKLIDEVSYAQDFIIKFEAFINNLMTFIFIVIIFILIVIVFFVSNTILLAIYSQKNDIDIYKLLGASNLFVKIPYMIEGMIFGFLGGIISTIMLSVIYYFINQYFPNDMIIISNFDIFKIIAFNFASGIFLGFLGCTKALIAYVKN